jgi:hypothetical protein
MPLIVLGEDQDAEFRCFVDRGSGREPHAFRAPRGHVDASGTFVPLWLDELPRCPTCGEIASIDEETPFTRAEFVAMLDALEVNGYLWEEQMWRNTRESNGFIAYARSLLPAA